jgi:two-component system, NarL family, nitrate/nitrite response regulator NarL
LRYTEILREGIGWGTGQEHMQNQGDTTSRTASLRVVIADDHTLFRTGLRRLLTHAGIEVVAEASNGREALDAVAAHAPDVLLTDLDMPVMGGVEATRRATVPVVVLSGSSTEDEVVEALTAGATGFIVKAAAVEAIVAALHDAVRGDSAFSPQVAALLARRVRDRRAAPREGARVHLTAREEDVLRHVAAGADNAAIARGLGVSASTVKDHVSRLLEKLGAHNRVQAAVWAARHGLVQGVAPGPPEDLPR